MTSRERASLTCLALGLACTAVAGYRFGGWAGLFAVVGAILLLIGVLLGLDDGRSELTEPAYGDFDETEDGVQRG